MAKVFHASIEGAQHGGKGLKGFLRFAQEAGAAGAIPSNFLLQGKDGQLLPAKEIKATFEEAGLTLDAISAHCPFWVHTSAWTDSPTIKPFLPKEMASKSLADIEQWAEDYCLRLLDLCAELGVGVVPMFWGVAYGWEAATGYPWGFWKGPGYDLIAEGDERFVRKTEGLRNWARKLEIILAHEIHPGTAAVCAQDFLHLVELCDGDKCLGVNADPSHCWEGEDWETRFRLVGNWVYCAHLKNYHIVPGKPLRCMDPVWANRAMQFTLLNRGDHNLVQYTRLLLQIGYPQRYCTLTGAKTAPLAGEAEDDSIALDEVSAKGISFIARHCCFDAAEVSFEEGMGEQE